LAAPIQLKASPDLQILDVNRATFLANNFEAFARRGQGEYVGDTDIEELRVARSTSSQAAPRVSPGVRGPTA